MKRRSIALASIWMMAVAGLSACSVHSNGSVGFGEDAPAKGPGYEEFDQYRQRIASEQDLREQEVQFEGRDGLAPAAQYDVSGTPRRPQGSDTRTLRLYGTTWGPPAPERRLLTGLENIEQVTFGTVGSDFDPDVDSEGKRVVFASTRHEENSDLYVMDIGSSSLTLVVSNPERDEMPAFSPDGRRIAFASNRRGNWDIFVSNLDGGAPIQMTNDPADEIHPSYSPDGKSLVYSVYAQRASRWHIVVMDIANPQHKRMIGDGLFPQWSPNGDKILFQRARGKHPRSFSIWTVDLVDGAARQPTEIVRCLNAAAITPMWSPDGRHVVFSTVVNPGSDLQDEGPVQADVWLVAADGTGRVNLTRSPFANLQPVWSPTGHVLFVSNRADGSRESIWAIRTEEPLTLTRSVFGARPTSTASGQDAPIAPIAPDAMAPDPVAPDSVEAGELAATREAADP